MNSKPSGVSQGPLSREALDWLVRLHSGEATGQDASSLAEWRSRSDDHEAAFRDAVRMRRGLQGLLQAREAHKVVQLRRAPVMNRRALFVGGGGALAASMVGGVLAYPPMDLWPSYAELTSRYRTGPGERRTVSPVAGVSIDMGSRTSIAGRRDGGLELVNGEAFVTVDRAASFMAAASGGAASAQRGAFNLRRIDGQVCVACIEGAVTVTAGERMAKLGPGQQLLYSRESFGGVQAVNSARATAWRTGQLIFQGEPLGQVVAEVNRYRTGRIVLADRRLARRQVSAVFHLDQITNAAAQLEELTGIRGRHLPGGIVLIG